MVNDLRLERRTCPTGDEAIDVFNRDGGYVFTVPAVLLDRCTADMIRLLNQTYAKGVDVGLRKRSQQLASLLLINPNAMI